MMRRWKQNFAAVSLMALVAFSCTRANSALVVHYQFEGDGTDSAGGDNNGVLNGGTTTSAPNLGGSGTQSLPLDGVDDYVSITNGTSIVPGGSKFTLAGFVNLGAFPSGTGTTEFIYFSNPSGGGAARLIMQIRGNGSDGASFSLGGRTQQADGFSRYLANVADVLGVGNTSLALNTTYHLAATVDTTLAPTNAVQLYLNGLPVSNSLQSGSGFSQVPFDNTVGASATVGSTGVPGNYLTGRVDDVRIYDEVLSAAQIRALAVPEPASIALLAIGLGLVALHRRK